ncbi:MAG: hypothetical protein R3C44_16705 [Chloroflexota bacterium]
MGQAPQQFNWPDAALIISAQLLIVLAIGFSWQTLQAVILPVVRPEMPEITGELNDLQTVFTTPEGRPLLLSGYVVDSRMQSDETVTASLVWEGEGPTLEPYTVFVHVVDAQGNLVAQQDNWPVEGLWPTTCWRPGEEVVDTYTIDLPQELPPGTYSLLAGVYGGLNAERLVTQDGQDTLHLGQFSVGQ